MMKRTTAAVIVVVVLAVGTSAFAQYTTTVSASLPGVSSARYMGMGAVGVAAADDAAALLYNPAALAGLPWQAAGTYELQGEVDYWAVHLAGSSPGSSMGLGFSYHSISLSPSEGWWLAGVGAPLGNGGWKWGASVMDSDLFGETIFTVGVLGNLPMGPGAPMRIGLTVEDVTNEYGIGPFINVGIACPLAVGPGRKLLLAADYLDATDENDSRLNVGLEYDTGSSWIWRAGWFDTDSFTAGFGYNGGSWRADLSWQEYNYPGVDDAIAATVYWPLK